MSRRALGRVPTDAPRYRHLDRALFAVPEPVEDVSEHARLVEPPPLPAMSPREVAVAAVSLALDTLPRSAPRRVIHAVACLAGATESEVRWALDRRHADGRLPIARSFGPSAAWFRELQRATNHK